MTEENKTTQEQLRETIKEPEEKIRKKGSGRVKGNKNKEDKYVLEYEDRKYLCKTQNEIAKITGRSRHCISRLIRGITTFRCPSKSAELKNIKITVL